MSDHLLDDGEGVVNAGIESFIDPIRETGVQVTDVDWEPYPDVDDALVDGLTALGKHESKIRAANERAAECLVEARPIWRDIQDARTALDLDGMTLCHAGPPVTWDNMSGPQRGAVIGAIQYEGWADSEDAARELAGSSDVSFVPCHERSAVGPMAGVISPSMPLAVVDNEAYGNTAYSNLNEGLGEVLRFGAYTPDVIENLQWMETELVPVLKQALAAHGGLDIKLLSSKALQMGDEVHNRNVAGTALLVRELAPTIATLDEDTNRIEEVLSFIGGNEHFFLNLSMGACKSATDAAADIPWSTVLTAMARNGTEFGIRVSGLEEEWFTAPAKVVDGLYFSDYSKEDASPDIGDSSIAETSGVGGFAMAGSPAITQFVGGHPQEALGYTKEMYEITITENENYALPPLDFRGTPTGIDLIQVIETGIQPIINTGIAHKEPGIGQIGAGIGRAPRECFIAAMRTYCEAYHDGSAPAEVSQE
jgi:hypothetical protein